MPIISIYISSLLGIVLIPGETEDHFVCARSETYETYFWSLPSSGVMISGRFSERIGKVGSM